MQTEADCQRRIWIIGPPGAGKSTLCKQLSSEFEIPHFELDDAFWGHDWTPVEKKDFASAVETMAAGCEWIIDGNYPKAAEVIRQRANLLVRFDIPFRITFPRLVARTIKRVRTRSEVCGKNQETLANVLFSKDGILYYAIRFHWRNKHRFEQFWNEFPGPRIRVGPKDLNLVSIRDMIDGIFKEVQRTGRSGF